MIQITVKSYDSILYIHHLPEEELEDFLERLKQEARIDVPTEDKADLEWGK